MAKTNDFELAQQYLLDYMKNLTKQLDLSQIKLNEQLKQCPIPLRSLNDLDDNLKQYVHRQRQNLLKRNTKQIKTENYFFWI